jgi:hypothetical protein
LVQRSRYRESDEVSNERGLPGDVVLRQPPHLAFADHVHRFDFLNRSPGRVKGSEPLTRSDPPLDGSVVLLNGLITNDKFCFIRVSRLKLEWKRRRRGIPVHNADLPNYLREEVTLSGGDHEARMASSPSVQPHGGCGATMGSGLSTSPDMDSVERAGFRSRAAALLSNRRRSKT